MHAKPNIFPVVVIMRGTPGNPYLSTGLGREVVRIDPEHRTTLRFEGSRFNLWVNTADDSDIILSLTLAHARVISMSETEVEVEGVEVKDFQMTGHAARIVLTNVGSGWAPEDAEE